MKNVAQHCIVLTSILLVSPIAHAAGYLDTVHGTAHMVESDGSWPRFI